MRLSFCGVRGSSPASGAQFVRYGGATSCVAVTRDGDDAPSLLLDVGTGAHNAMPLLRGAPFRGAMLLTHLHWDHTQGLPFFRGANRDDATSAVFLPDQGDARGAAELMDAVMSPPVFPIGVGGLHGAWSFTTVSAGTFEAAGWRVTAAVVPHRGGTTLGYRIEDGHSAACYVPDHCPTDLGAGPDGLGEYHEAVCALAQGADVLVHDATLWPEEVPQWAHYGHAAADYAVGLGRRCEVGVVALFHHRQDRTDDELDALAERLGTGGGVVVAREGLEVAC